MLSKDELLTVSEAARRLGRDRATITSWIKAGIVATVTEGKRKYVKASTVVEMLEAREGES